MDFGQIGRSDCELKLIDLKTENLVELLREINAHLHNGCISFSREGRCSIKDRATTLLRNYDNYLKEIK
jgi:hypothetical protein